MAISQVSSYAPSNTDPTNLMETVDDTRIGLHELTLTEYATLTVPQIAAGSVIEVGGTLYKAGTNQSISGSPADGSVFVYMVPSGASPNQILTPTFTNTTPTWFDSKQGYYDATGTYRYIHYIMTKSGASYYKYEYLTKNNRTMSFGADGRIYTSGIMQAASGFTGNLTGNVTGNVTGNLDGDLTKGTAVNVSSGLAVSGAVNCQQVIGRYAATVVNGDFDNENGSFTGSVIRANCDRAASSLYNIFSGYSGNYGDLEFRLSGDGNGTCDGAWTGGGADYAEYFEWEDGNPDNEDRTGMTVVISGDKIRIAKNNDIPIGVISSRPSVVGNDPLNWSMKYLKDEYGRYILNKKGERKLSPEYDGEKEYKKRSERIEWGCVGLMGRLRIRNDQIINNNWIKMKGISKNVTEYFVK